MDYLNKAKEFAGSSQGQAAMNSTQGKDLLNKFGLSGAAASFGGHGGQQQGQQGSNQQRSSGNDDFNSGSCVIKFISSNFNVIESILPPIDAMISIQ